MNLDGGVHVGCRVGGGVGQAHCGHHHLLHVLALLLQHASVKVFQKTITSWWCIWCNLLNKWD